MRIGIVGNGEDKFTKDGALRAQEKIIELLSDEMESMSVYEPITVVSGHSPVGGIDIWAEEIGKELGCDLDLKIPEVHQWNPPGGYGYRTRNLDIAESSDVLYVIVALEYPDIYTGRRFKDCYHCAKWAEERPWHVKSGGCWTGKQAIKMGKEVHWIFIEN